MEPLAYRVNAFCKAIGIGHTKFYQLLAAGRIRTVVIGGRRLIPADEAQRIANEGTEPDCLRGATMKRR